MPATYTSRLIRQESTAVQTGTFYFEKPSEFRFAAGQFVDVILPDRGLSEVDRIHTFSICSAPAEDHIAITSRLRDSPFKQVLRQLPANSAVAIEGPYGKFVIGPDTPRPIAFLVGGVGITPAYSILKQAARDASLANLYLFDSNRNQAETPFLAELAELQAAHSEFHLIATMTADDAWPGEKERINMDMLCRYLDPFSTTFYTAGPPAMVTAMREMLAQNGVRQEQVRFESFAGY